MSFPIHILHNFMKKYLTLAIVAALLAVSAPAAQAARQPGGAMAGLIGCCFGMRTAAAWNDGKNLGIRDILDILAIGRIWSAITAWGGTNTSDLHAEGPQYY